MYFICAQKRLGSLGQLEGNDKIFQIRKIVQVFTHPIDNVKGAARKDINAQIVFFESGELFEVIR